MIIEKAEILEDNAYSLLPQEGKIFGIGFFYVYTCN